MKGVWLPLLFGLVEPLDLLFPLPLPLLFGLGFFSLLEEPILDLAIDFDFVRCSLWESKIQLEYLRSRSGGVYVL